MRTLLISSAFALALLAGCTTTGDTYRSPDVQRVNEKTGKVEYVSSAKTLEMGFLNNFSDLPIPGTHKADLSQSMLFTSTSQSIGRITLKGPADMDSLFRFFQDNMTAKGWKMVQNKTFDLVILDINLPGMNGYELCRKIRDNDTGIPVIMLTALTSLNDKIEGYDSGADDYVVKPFEFRELLMKVRVLLKRTSTQQQHPTATADTTCH